MNPTIVWVCEHPYRTLRATGPDHNCDGCPVWAEMERARACADPRTAEEVAALEALLAS